MKQIHQNFFLLINKFYFVILIRIIWFMQIKIVLESSFLIRRWMGKNGKRDGGMLLLLLQLIAFLQLRIKLKLNYLISQAIKSKPYPLIGSLLLSLPTKTYLLLFITNQFLFGALNV